MPRFILRHLCQGPAPQAVVKRVRALPDAKIVEETPRMLLVESTDDLLRSALDNPANWLIVPEQQVPMPDARPKPKRKT